MRTFDRTTFTPRRRRRQPFTGLRVLSHRWQDRLVHAARQGLLEIDRANRRARHELGGDALAEYPAGAAACAREVVDRVREALLRRDLDAHERSMVLWQEELPPADQLSQHSGSIVIDGPMLDDAVLAPDRDADRTLALTAGEVTRDGRVRPLAGAISRADGKTVSWSVPGGVVEVAYPAMSPYADVRHYALRRGDVVAGDAALLVCATTRADGLWAMVDAIDREVAAALDLRIRPGTANGSVVGLLHGPIGGVVQLASSPVLDAALLVPLQLAGGSVHDLDGRPRNPLRELERLATGAVRPRVIEPYVAVATPAALRAFLAVRAAGGAGASTDV